MLTEFLRIYRQCAGAYLQIHRLLRLDHANEVAGHNAALVDELVEGVLAVGPWLSKVYLTGIIWQTVAVNAYTLAIALHGYLEERSSHMTHEARQHEAQTAAQKKRHEMGGCTKAHCGNLCALALRQHLIRANIRCRQAIEILDSIHTDSSCSALLLPLK